jgi:NhaA family Na+:H+ antiporter
MQQSRSTSFKLQSAANRALSALQRFLHVESASGVVLLMAALIALIWANSAFAATYNALWHLPVSIGIGDHSFSKSLHFLINDALMTVFFLVVGMEVRREIHNGALSKLDQAALPLIAAAGGVVVPAIIYLSFNAHPVPARGWAVPTATDIAFAVGVLALLGKSVPLNVRIILLALAIIDDVIAVLVIAFFYSGGLQLSGLFIAFVGILLVVGMQRANVGSAFAYIAPGAIVWFGIMQAGAHPTLAGVVLGLMTPVRPMATAEPALAVVARATAELRASASANELHRLNQPLRRLRVVHRELLPPVSRVQTALHPWVAFGIMPLFALANAGVSVRGVDLGDAQSQLVMSGIVVALFLGKPIGVVGATWLAVRLGVCRLPPGVSWHSMWLIGLLAGIGFTMSIFIAMLAFADEGLLNAAKLGVLLGSVLAAVAGLAWGRLSVRHGQPQPTTR